jgi:hypothetical protein
MRADDMKMKRLGQGGETPSSLEARAGAFLGQARDTVGLTDAEVVAIERRLLRKVPAGGMVRLWPVIAAAAVLLVGGSVMALVGPWRSRLPFVGGTPETSPPRPAGPRSKLVPTRAATPADPASVLPEPAHAPSAAEAPLGPEHALEPRVPARRGPRQEPLSSVLPSSLHEGAPRDSPLSAEARSLADALARWRRDKKGEAALKLLDAHDRRFVDGALSVESKVARAEILLALARRDRALAVLDSLGLAGLPRAREIATVRGELRAEAGRCREARADLQRVLQDTPGDEFARRAKAALAQCR